MYAPGPGARPFLGVMYLAGGDRRGPQPGGPDTTWHYHVFGAPVCMIQGGFPLELAAADGSCVRGRPELRSPEMLHVWAHRTDDPFASSMAATDHARHHQ